MPDAAPKLPVYLERRVSAEQGYERASAMHIQFSRAYRAQLASYHLIRLFPVLKSGKKIYLPSKGPARACAASYFKRAIACLCELRRIFYAYAVKGEKTYQMRKVSVMYIYLHVRLGIFLHSEHVRLDGRKFFYSVSAFGCKFSVLPEQFARLCRDIPSIGDYADVACGSSVQRVNAAMRVDVFGRSGRTGVEYAVLFRDIVEIESRRVLNDIYLACDEVLIESEEISLPQVAYQPARAADKETERARRIMRSAADAIACVPTCRNSDRAPSRRI